MASQEDSENVSESSASRLLNQQQYSPTQVFVEQPTEVVELPIEPAELPLVPHFYS